MAALGRGVLVAGCFAAESSFVEAARFGGGGNFSACAFEPLPGGVAALGLVLDPGFAVGFGFGLGFALAPGFALGLVLTLAFALGARGAS